MKRRERIVREVLRDGKRVVTTTFDRFEPLGGPFVLDTGSPHLHVLVPFMARFAAEIAQHWTSDGRPFVERYLEGDVELQPYRVARFAFAGSAANELIVGGQIPAPRGADLAFPFDGIIGTDILQNFDLYVDYDHAARLSKITKSHGRHARDGAPAPNAMCVVVLWDAGGSRR